MSQLNTLKLRDALQERVKNFAVVDHDVRDDKLRDALRAIWSGPGRLGGLGGELWVEGAFPPEPQPENMEALVRRGLIHPELGRQLDRTGAFPSNLCPYRHQLESFEAAFNHGLPNGQKPAVVVSAGTGAGKTESFLIPMLNELWTQPGIPGEGVSALLLYPMNALVNDQVTRLDRWLEGQEQVSFFHFTSETPENHKFASKRNLPPATPARFRTRQQARGCEDLTGKRIPGGNGPRPDVLITNYSMLEYMLCRPQDQIFFGKNLKVVVLDEAHIYSGNLAAEIALLLRRLLLRCGRDPSEILFYATSATIGGGAQKLRPFAATLFSKPEVQVRVIEGRRQCPDFDTVPVSLPLPESLVKTILDHPFPDEETLEFRDNALHFRRASKPNCVQARRALQALSGKEPTDETDLLAPMLHKALSRNPVMAALQQELWHHGDIRPIALTDLARTLFKRDDVEAIEATRHLLQAGAVARAQPHDLPLVPNRMHFLMRGPEGMMIVFGAEAQAMVPISDQAAIFSPAAEPESFGVSEHHPLTLFRQPESGWWGVAGVLEGTQLDPVPESVVIYNDDLPVEDGGGNGKICFYSLQEVPGCPTITFDPKTGRVGANGSVTLWKVDNCPVTGEEFKHKSVGWFGGGTRLQLGLITETALASMPEFPSKNNVWLPARGRRLLVFSDSRSEAARLGPHLRRNHESQVFRAALVNVLEQSGLVEQEAHREALLEELTDLQEQLGTVTEARKRILERRIEQTRRDLAELDHGFQVSTWAEKLKNSTIVAELFDEDEGVKHTCDRLPAEIWNDNKTAIQARLVNLMGKELARRLERSSEALGFVEIVYPGTRDLFPPDSLLGLLPKHVADTLETIWPDLLAFLLDNLRTNGAITLGNDEDDRNYLFGGGKLGRFFSLRHKYRSQLIPLIGQLNTTRQSDRNRFVQAVLIRCGLADDAAMQMVEPLMKAVFEQLRICAQNGTLSWLEVDPDQPTGEGTPVTGLRLKFEKLALRQPAKLFRCSQTGRIWPRSVLGLYPGVVTRRWNRSHQSNSSRIGA